MNKTFRTLYEYTINRKEKTKEVTDNSDSSQTIREVDKDVPHKFYVKKPSGSEKSAAELYQYRTYGAAVSSGVITYAILQKRIADEGGLFSREEIKLRDSLTEQLRREISDFKTISDKKEEDRTEGEKTTLAELDKSIQGLSKRLNEYTNAENNLGMTAESLTQKNSLLWWVLFLLYKDGPEGPEPLFKGTDFADRQESYNDIQDKEDEFLDAAISRGAIAIRCWMSLGKVSDEILEKITSGATE